MTAARSRDVERASATGTKARGAERGTRDREEREAWEARIRDAKAVPLMTVLHDFGATAGLKKTGGEYVGPCPGCGGHDRFSVNPAKGVWNCRHHGGGRTAIGLLMHIADMTFAEAVKALTPSDGDDAGRKQRANARRRSFGAPAKASGAAATAVSDRESNPWRDQAIGKARAIWAQGCHFTGTPVTDYLKGRGIFPLTVNVNHSLQYHDDLPYWETVEGPWGKETAIIHRGPAMLAAIWDMHKNLIGVHRTWIDPSLASRPDPRSSAPLGANGKARIVHPDTGELCPAKKVIGSVKGGRILLCGPADADTLVVGEGIETVLAYHALVSTGRHAFAFEREAPLERVAFQSSVTLGNLSGRSAGRVKHPTEKKRDKRGRERAVTVPGSEPHPDDAPDLARPTPLLFPVHPNVKRIVLLGDGDSDLFWTQCAMARGEKRLARAGRTIVTDWAPVGADWADVARDLARGGGGDVTGKGRTDSGIEWPDCAT